MQILTLSNLNLFEEKKNLKRNKQVKSKSMHRSLFSPSFQYQKQLNSIGKDPNYDLITPNGIIRHFIVFIDVEDLGS